jgi:hypothetical protein
MDLQTATIVGGAMVLGALAYRNEWLGKARVMWGKVEAPETKTVLISRTDDILHDGINAMWPGQEEGTVNVELENQGTVALDKTALLPLHETAFLAGSDWRMLLYDPDNKGRSLEIATRRRNVDLVQENAYLLGELDRYRERHKEKTEEDTELQKQTTTRVIQVKRGAQMLEE